MTSSTLESLARLWIEMSHDYRNAAELLRNGDNADNIEFHLRRAEVSRVLAEKVISDEREVNRLRRALEPLVAAIEGARGCR